MVKSSLNQLDRLYQLDFCLSMVSVLVVFHYIYDSRSTVALLTPCSFFDTVKESFNVRFVAAVFRSNVIVRFLVGNNDTVVFESLDKYVFSIDTFVGADDGRDIPVVFFEGCKHGAVEISFRWKHSSEWRLRYCVYRSVRTNLDKNMWWVSAS